MSQLSISYNIVKYESLAVSEQEVVDAAVASMKRAYAPYSKFHVGSAVRDIHGKITTGNNQENAAYPSGLCAERVALFSAKSQSKVPLEVLVVMAENAEGKEADAFPCGSCRQVMLEYASLPEQEEPIKILMRQSDSSFVVLDDVSALLPFRFDAKKLK